MIRDKKKAWISFFVHPEQSSPGERNEEIAKAELENVAGGCGEIPEKPICPQCSSRRTLSYEDGFIVKINCLDCNNWFCTDIFHK